MLTLHLRIAGAIILLLLAAYPVYPIRFGWHEELQTVSSFTRQMFWVHMGFICLMLGLQGLLLVRWPDVLTVASPAAVALLVGMAAFWSYRLLAQLVFYSPALWWGRPLETLVHVVFTILWMYLAGVCAWALGRQWVRMRDEKGGARCRRDH